MAGAMYLRKSRADIELEKNGEMETLKRHEKILLSVAKSLNLNINKIYREIVSGETISARPEIQKLLSEVEEGKWDFVLVMEIERLARGDTIDQGIVSRAFKAHNTKIVTPIKTYDPSNEFDEEYFEFGLFMSRREFKTINRRIQRGRIQSAAEGRYLGSVAPYGYDKIKIPNDKGYTLKPNHEADAVKLIYNLYLEGNGCTVISRTLDKKGVLPRSGGKWSKASIKDILKNPVYIGKINWSKGNQNIYADGLHEAIIDENTFYNVQEAMKKHYRPPTKADAVLKNPLAGLVRCKKCGALMTRLGTNTRNRVETLKCSNKYCNNVSAPLYLVESEIVSALKNWLEVYKLNLEETTLNPAETKIREEQKRITVIKKEIDKVKAQIAKTYELLEREIYTVDVFLERNQALKKQQEQLHSQIAVAEAEIKEQQHISYISVNKAEMLLNSYSEHDTAEDRNQILKILLSNVTYNKDFPNHRGNLENLNFDIEIFPKLPTKD